MKKVIKDIFLKVIVSILSIYELHSDSQLLAKRMTTEKVKKLAVNLNYKTEYVIHVRNLKEALNHGLILKKVLRVIKFNQNAYLISYIDMNTDQRKENKK